MKQLAMDIGPEFVESVTSETTEETQAGPDSGAVSRVVAGSAPSVRKKVRAGDCYQSGVSGHQVSIAILRHESHCGCVPKTMAEGRACSAVVTRIFTPNRAQSRFHGVACRDTAQAHAIAITKALPMWAISLGRVNQGAKPGAKQASGETIGTNSTLHHPVNPF